MNINGILWKIPIGNECLTKAITYKNITDFSINEYNMYEFARKRNWLNDIKNNINNGKIY